MSIDWHSDSNEVFINPRMPETDRQRLLMAMPSIKTFKQHVWLSTSGSSGKLKWVALSKPALLASAYAVNVHLDSHSSDIWFNPLPIFHVGGLGIYARSHLSGAALVCYENGEGRWQPQAFVQQLIEAKASLTALVPTQVFDLVSQNIIAPPNLRAAIVGGGALSTQLYLEAVERGWKLLPSYGLTECASQVATAPLDSWNERQMPLLQPLSHVTLAIDDHGHLKIKSPALLSAYIYIESDIHRLCDPKVDGWFCTDDKAILERGWLKTVSRTQNFVKIGGENVDLMRLEKILDEVKLYLNIHVDMALAAIPDARLGHAIHLVMTFQDDNLSAKVVEDFALRVLPFERIRQVHCVDEIPRSPLKKVLSEALQQKLLA